MLKVIGSPLNSLRQRSILRCHKNEVSLKERGLETNNKNKRHLIQTITTEKP